MQISRSSRPVWLALVLVFASVAVALMAFSSGYGSGKDAALRDNRADAARAAQQNVEG
jgi:hypothetical protein